MIPSSIPIYPGEGISNSLTLGQSLYSVINHFNKSDQQYQQHQHKLQISYSSTNYLKNPILVTLPHWGIRLMFENLPQQRLILIEVLNFNFLKFTYNGQLLNDILLNEIFNDNEGDVNPMKYEKIYKIPTLKQIYNKSFGPTYPGKLNLTNKTYILSYPGISFKFKIELNELMSKLSNLKDDSKILSRLINWNKSNDISVKSLSIFNGDNYNYFHENVLQRKNMKIVSNDNLGSGTGLVSIDKLNINVLQGLIKVYLKYDDSSKIFNIKIGETTQQEILNNLGPPDDYFNKFDSRLLIHNHLKSLHQLTKSKTTSSSNLSSTSTDDNHSDNSIFKFHNYFKFGLDFLFDLNNNNNHKNTGVLTKIIIHNGGITESLDFMRWNKCNWEMISGKPDSNLNSKSMINSSMYFNEIPQSFFNEINLDSNNNDKELRPVLLNRNESEFIDDDLEFVQPDEFQSNTESSTNSSNSINSNDSSNLKTWGQSKLYGCHRCIWEVIESNGCISSVTLY